MTRRELDMLCSTCIACLSRVTASGIESLTAYHSGTIQLLRWYRLNMVQVCDAAVPALNALLTAIERMSQDRRLVHPPTTQPSLDWEQTPL